jgi:hypothetical protein
VDWLTVPVFMAVWMSIVAFYWTREQDIALPVRLALAYVVGLLAAGFVWALEALAELIGQWLVILLCVAVWIIGHTVEKNMRADAEKKA